MSQSSTHIVRGPRAMSRSLRSIMAITIVMHVCGCGKISTSLKNGDSLPTVTAEADAGDDDPKAVIADLSSAKSNLQHAVVKSEGAGATRDEALQDAFRNAVRQVVGLFVDEETRIQNDEVISDQVLTYSEGIVKEYQELDISKNGSIWRAKIVARIERGKVVQRLHAAKVSIKEVDGTGLYSEIVTGLEKKKKAAGIIEKALGRFPLDCMTAILDGKPEVVNPTEKEATLRLHIRVATDVKAYDSMAAKLLKSLDAVTTTTSELTISPHNLRTPPGFQWAHNGGASAIQSNILAMYNGGRLSPHALTVFVNTDRTNDYKRHDWRTFEVNDSLRQAFAIRSYSVMGVKTTLIEKGNIAIVTDRFSLATPGNFVTPFTKYQHISLIALGHQRERPGIIGFRPTLPHAFPQSTPAGLELQLPDGLELQLYESAMRRKNGQFAIVAPFDTALTTADGNLNTFFRFSREIKLSLEEIRSIHKVNVELTFPGPYPPKPPNGIK